MMITLTYLRRRSRKSQLSRNRAGITHLGTHLIERSLDGEEMMHVHFRELVRDAKGLPQGFLGATASAEKRQAQGLVYTVRAEEGVVLRLDRRGLLQAVEGEVEAGVRQRYPRRRVH